MPLLANSTDESSHNRLVAVATPWAVHLVVVVRTVWQAIMLEESSSTKGLGTTR